MVAASALAGQVCLVVGASRGLGLAAATHLAGRGVSVVGTIRTPSTGAEQAARIATEAGQRLDLHPCDITDPDSVAATVEETLARYGRIDSVVHSAGLWRGGRLDRLPPEDWRLVLDTDLAGLFTVVQAVLPAMLAAGSGRIIAITSVIGITGYPGDTAYSAAKAGANMLVRSLAKEVAAKGISVNALAPGPVATDMTRQLGDEGLSRLLKRVPLGRQGTPEEVAEMVELLLLAPALLAGAVIPLDGAMS